MTTSPREEPALIRVQRHEEPGDRAVAEVGLTLTFDLRQRSRFRATLDDGRSVGVVLERGRVLREGDVLWSDCGLRVAVHAAQEELAIVEADDALDLARACYHLGNRHVPLQIDASGCRFQRDHVLEEMLREHGLRVRSGSATFDPEGGAYGHGPSHGHGGGHGHDGGRRHRDHAHGRDPHTGDRDPGPHAGREPEADPPRA